MRRSKKSGREIFLNFFLNIYIIIIINFYIYLIKEREFIKTKELIYKIGKTKQENLQRIKSYPNGSILLLYIITNDCDKKEKEIIQKFKEHFIHKNNINTILYIYNNI